MSQPETTTAADARPGPGGPRVASAPDLLPGTAALLKRWFEACSADDETAQQEPGVQIPEPEAREVLEALLDHLRGASPDRLEPAGRAWGSAHRSVAGVVEHLSHLREILLTSSLGNRLEVHRALDRITALATVEVTERIERVSRTDALTGVGNRRAFDETIQATLSAASRQGHDVTVVAVDLDGLKKINDTHGHAAGDAALVSLVGALNDALRDEDTIFRLGGDEFVMVLPFTSVDMVDALMRRVAGAGAPSFTWGAAGYPQDGGEPKALVAAADMDMYRHRGLNRAPRKAARSAAPKERSRPARLGRLAWIPAAAVLMTSVVVTLLSATSGPQVLAKKPPGHATHSGSTTPAAVGPAGGALAAGPAGSNVGTPPASAAAGSIPNAATASYTEPLVSTPAPGNTGGSSSGGAQPAGGARVPSGATSANGGGSAPASDGGAGSSGQPSGGSGSGGVFGTVSQLLSPVPVVGGSGGLVSVVDELLTGQSSAAAGSGSSTSGSGITSLVAGPLGIG